MKKFKLKYISVIIVIFIIIELIFSICSNNTVESSEKQIYDVILFWGQSNMTGYCGTEEGEKTKDSRYDYTNANSVKAFSKNTGIDEGILSNSIKTNYVKISQEPGTAYEYYYIGDKLQELNSNTQYSGELLKYNSSTKKLETATSPYSIQKSYGTNVIPQFCKTYYNNYGKNSGHKVVAVLASNGGENIQNFLPSTDSEYGDTNKQLIYEAMLTKYKAAVNYIEKNNGVVGNKLWVSFQGEANVRKTSTSEYKRLFLKVHNYIKRDFGITKGAIIETSHRIGENLYNEVNNIHNAQEQLAKENSDIIIGSRYAYNRFVPDESAYNSSSFNNDIFKDSNGNKLSYANAFNKASYSTCYLTNNTIHFTSAALSQIGKEAAENLAEEVRDKVAPQLQIKYDITEKTNKDVTVTITANEPVKEISGWTRSSDKKILTKVYTTNKTEEIKVYDLEGNESKITVAISNIDKISPNYSIAYSTTEVTNQDVTVIINTNEQLQKLEGWEISTDNKRLTKKYTKNTEESVTIKDLVGNETIVNIKIINIDKTKPTVNVKYSTTEVTNQDVEVNIVANEEIQEVEGWEISTDKKKLTKKYTKNAEESVTIKDLTGNETIVNIKITNIDKTKPTVNVKYSTTEITNQDVEVTISSNKELQEVEGWKISTDKKKLTKKYTKNVEESVTIKDLTGNETIANIKITNIDKTNPTVNVKYSTTEVTNQDVEVTISSNKELQEVEGWKISTDKKKLTKKYTKNVEESVTIKDLTGNETIANIKITNIDKTNPTVNVKYSTTEVTNQDVEVTISSNKELQEVEGWEISTDKKKLTKKYTKNAEESVTIKDLVGNETIVNIKITNIDKTKPTVNVKYSTTEITNQDVEVTISSNKELQEVEGWKISTDNKKLTKKYTKNAEESVTIKDLAGNEEIVNIKVTNIDKEKPKIENIEKIEIEEGIKIIVNAEDELSKINSYSFNGGKTWQESNEKIYTENIENIVILVKDNVGNIIESEPISITNLDKLEISSSEYEIIEDAKIKYIEKIMPNTTIEMLENMINTNGTIEIYQGENKLDNKKTLVGTGMKIKIKLRNYEEIFELVVKGDLNGDGKISITDVLKLARYNAKLDKQLEIVQLKAGDVIKNGKIGMPDIVKISRVLAHMDNF